MNIDAALCKVLCRDPGQAKWSCGAATLDGGVLVSQGNVQAREEQSNVVGRLAGQRALWRAAHDEQTRKALASARAGR